MELKVFNRSCETCSEDIQLVEKLEGLCLESKVEAFSYSLNDTEER